MLQFNCICLLKYMTNFIVSDVTEQSSLRRVRIKEKIYLVCVILASKTICSHLWKFCTTPVCSLTLNLVDEISCFSSWILHKCLCKHMKAQQERTTWIVTWTVSWPGPVTSKIWSWPPHPSTDEVMNYGAPYPFISCTFMSQGQIYPQCTASDKVSLSKWNHAMALLTSIHAMIGLNLSWNTDYSDWHFLRS